jgi:hypothetical protein
VIDWHHAFTMITTHIGKMIPFWNGVIVCTITDHNYFASAIWIPDPDDEPITEAFRR